MTTATERIEVAGYEVSSDHFIGGARVASERRFEDISPIDSEVIGEVSRASEDEVDKAVSAAHDAFPDWADLGPAGRAPYLRRLADLIDQNVDRLAAVENMDMAMLLRSWGGGRAGPGGGPPTLPSPTRSATGVRRAPGIACSACPQGLRP
jgi:hypothetical protein